MQIYINIFILIYKKYFYCISDLRTYWETLTISFYSDKEKEDMFQNVLSQVAEQFSR